MSRESKRQSPYDNVVFRAATSDPTSLFEGLNLAESVQSWSEFLFGGMQSNEEDNS